MAQFQTFTKQFILPITAIIGLLFGLAIGLFIQKNQESNMTNHLANQETSKSMDNTSHEMMEHKTQEVQNLQNPPSISNLSVTKDKISGWNLSFEYSNFEFAPQNASQNHISGQEHAHLHINDQKVARLYSNNYHLNNLVEGPNQISVFLNTNDHKEYVINGAGIGMEILVNPSE